MLERRVVAQSPWPTIQEIDMSVLARTRRANLAVAALALVAVTALAACGGGSSTNQGAIGDHVEVSNGTSVTLAGTTRTNLDKLVSAGVAKDTVGAQQLIANGEIVAIDNCSTALVLDQAIGGETQVRVISDPGSAELNGQALWVNSEFAVKGTPKGC
jgi:hypothetical protein